MLSVSSVKSPRVAPNPMEVRGAIASYDAATDSYDFYTPNQGHARNA